MNRYVSHVYVIPEDDRDRQVANGFALHHQVKVPRIQIVPPAGGWRKVLETFQNVYIPKLREYADAHVIMLIDFDGDIENRKAEVDQLIPEELKERVFVIGSKHTPETLKKELKMSFEDIGTSLAADCDEGNTAHWDHEQLRHNGPDRERLVQTVKPFLF